MRRRADGMTLVELLAAMAIFLGLAGMVLQVLGGGLQLWTSGERSRGETEQAAQILDRLAFELRHLVTIDRGLGRPDVRLHADFLRQDSQNALFSDMIKRVEQDESRHAAFGILSMRRVVREADASEMAEMEDWTFSILEALNANQQLDMFRTLGPKYGLDPESVVGMITSLPNFAELNSLLFMHTVIPNLRNLGLMTERTADAYEAVGICHAGQRQTLPEGRVDFGDAMH